MKRIIAFIITLVCVLLFVSGCSVENEKDSEIKRLEAESKALDIVSDKLNQQINDLENAWDNYQKNK